MSLRIGITADPYLPVPPRLYGGIERIIDLLVRGLAARGHQVTLFGHADSSTPAADVVTYGSPPHRGVLHRGRELAQLGRALLRRRRSLDLVHSFGRLAALLPVLPLHALPKIQSYQRPVPWRSVRRAVQLGGDSLRFTACSAGMFRDATPAHGNWRRVFNGVDVDRYTFVESVLPDAPVVYLGKIEEMKGVHLAIDVAVAAGRRLVIAGNVPARGPEAQYFAERIAPRLVPGRIEFVGPVDDRQKDDLLGQAAALVFPTLYDEAFGIVMAEAMACGTPVIGWANGSVPEVVKHGVTGFVCRTVEDAAAAVHCVSRIERRVVRGDCELRFSARVIVDQYEALYREMLA